MANILNLTGNIGGVDIVVTGARTEKLHEKKFVEYRDRYNRSPEGKVVKHINIDKATGAILPMGYGSRYVDEDGKEWAQNELETVFIMENGDEQVATKFGNTVGKDAVCTIQRLLPKDEANNYLVENVYVLTAPDPANQIHKLARMLWESGQVAMVAWIIRETIEPQWAVLVPEFKPDGTYQIYIKATRQKLDAPVWISPNVVPPTPKGKKGGAAAAPAMPI